MELLLVWIVCAGAAIAWASLSRRSRWWVGVIGAVALGPLAPALVWLDVATYRSAPS